MGPATKVVSRPHAYKHASVSVFLYADQVELRRLSLLERLRRVQPKIVALIAPAGFGKSTLARQLVYENAHASVCDAAGIVDDLDLAVRLIPALAVESPERTTSLTQRELMLADGGTSVADRVNIALEAWKTKVTGATIIFENAEQIAKSASAREFFGRLLATRPEGRTVIICSRENLRTHLTRFAPPHQIMTMRGTDLAFDESEIAQIFAPYTNDAAVIAHIGQLSQGWPIAVFLLRRFAQEGRIESLLDKLDDVAFDELHDYLADEVLSSLPPGLTECVFACAAIPNPSLDDLRPLFKIDATLESLVEFSKESPFVGRLEDGTFAVHPLLKSYLLEYQDERRRLLLAQAARGQLGAKRFPRAAELYLACGDQVAAAEALGKHEVISDHAPSMEYARVLASLDRGLVQSYPRLWGVTALMRMFCVPSEELLEEAEAIWRTLSPETTQLERFYVLLFRVLFMSYIGMLEEAEELLRAFAAESGDEKRQAGIFDPYVHYLYGVLHARMGRLSDAERDLTQALPRISGMDVMVSGTNLTLGADIARVRGEFAVSRQFIERAIDAAKRSTLTNFVAFDYAEAVFCAWFSGDDTSFGPAVQHLTHAVQRHGVHGLDFFTEVAIGHEAEPREPDVLKWVICGRLMAAAQAPNMTQALRLSKAALAGAESYHTPFLECISAVACAAFDDLHCDGYLDRAMAAAERCESPALVSAVIALRAREDTFGMLTAFVKRLQRERAERVPLLEVSLTDGTVRAHGKPVSLPERELALLAAIAVRNEVVSRAELAEMLWPALDEYASRNSLSVTLHRLRNHLGVDEAIARSGEGLCLHEDARVDVWEIERLVASLRARKALNGNDRALLQSAYARLRARRPEKMRNWEWFEPIERRIGALRLEVTQRLAAEALERTDVQQALVLAQEMIAYDACDEGARDLAIRALLQAGDHAGAMRHYRQYRETLWAELQCEPSPALQRLVGLSGKTA